MNRGQEITEKLMALQKAIVDLNPLLSRERVSFEMLTGDCEAQEMRKKKLMEENTILESALANKKIEGEKILATYKEKAAEILAAANERNTKSMLELEKVKEFVKGMDKKQYKELAENVSH